MYIRARTQTHTHTHTCSDQSLRSVSGMHRTCKKQLGHLKRLDGVFEGKPHARSDWMLAEMVMSKSLKERFRLRKPYESRSHQKTEIRRAGSGLSRMPWTKTGKGNCRHADWDDWHPNLYHHQIKWVSALVAVPNDLPLPPAYYSENQQESQEKFYICCDGSHTHTDTHTHIYIYN